MKSLYKYALFFAAGLGAMTSCSDENAVLVNEESGNEVKMVVTAFRESEAKSDSRTTFTEVDGSLKCRWSEKDMLVVTNEKGIIKGYLTLSEGAGAAFGKFEGTLKGVDNGNPTLNYFYFGTAPSAEKCESIEDYEYIKDYAQQLGSFESLVQYDILSVTKEVIVEKGNSYVENIDLSRRVSYARFNLNFPESATYPIKVVLSGAEIANKATLDLASTEAVYEKGNVEATVTSKDKDLYITYLPTANLYELTFNAEDADGKTFTGKFDVEYVIPQGVYYRKTLKDEGGNTTGYGGLPVDFTEDQPDYDIIFKTYPDGTENNPDYDFEENLSDPTNVPLPGDPTEGETHKEFKGWKIEGSDDEPTKNPWDLTAEGKGPKVTLVPVYGDWIWTIEWRSGYGDNALVEHQGQTTYTNAESGNQAQVQTPFGLGGSSFNPVREGFTFNRWVNGEKEAKKTVAKTQWIRFYANDWTHVWTAEWNRDYEIVYHFNSADPEHSWSNTEPNHNTNYNAMLIDRPNGVEFGYNYIIIAPTSTRFDNQGKVAMTNAAGGKFLGWKKCVECADDYDASAAERLLNAGDTWTFEGGKWRLHLEPVYEEVVADPTTVTAPGYIHDTFNR